MRFGFYVLCCLWFTNSLAQPLPPPQPVEESKKASTPKAPEPETPRVVEPAPVPQVVENPPAETSAPVAMTPAMEPASTGAGLIFPSTFRPDPVSLNAKVAAGAAFNATDFPRAFWMIFDAEAQLDKFIAFGPKFQWGTGSSTDYYLGSIGPRFVIPVYFFEFGLHGGMGFAYRSVSGLEFSSFLYNAGINIDFYLIENLSLGANYDANFLSSQAEDFVSAFTGSLAFHF